MKNKLFLASLLLVLPAALSFAPADHAAETRPNKPNIIFILFDDLGYGEPTSFRASSPFKMPNLDRSAKEPCQARERAAWACQPGLRYIPVTAASASRRQVISRYTNRCNLFRIGRSRTRQRAIVAWERTLIGLKTNLLSSRLLVSGYQHQHEYRQQSHANCDDHPGRHAGPLDRKLARLKLHEHV
jgi:hypothetical protein